jgi:hypothetical protein
MDVVMRPSIRVTISIVFLLLGCRLCSQPSPSHGGNCESATACNVAGSLALAKGKIDTALDLFRREIIFAEKAHDQNAALLGYNNMAVAYCHSKEYSRAAIWAEIAKRTGAQDERTSHNLKLIQAHMPQSVSKGIKGLYVQYAGMGLWNRVRVFEKDGTIHFDLTAYRVDTASDQFGPASYGDVEGQIAPADGRIATFQSDRDYPDCNVRFEFGNGGADIKQSGDCGFGYGVDASGRYERIGEQYASKPSGPDANLP